MVASKVLAALQTWPILWVLLIFAVPALAAADGATPSESEMTARYERAAEIQQAQSRHWLLNEAVVPHWILGRDQFWYEKETDNGHRYVVIDAATGAKSDAFDHERLARELARMSNRKVDPARLPLKGASIDHDVVLFSAFDRSWRFDAVEGLTEVSHPRSSFLVSPDGRSGVFSKGANLWLKDFASGSERPLTTDGEPHYSYGTAPEAQTRRAPAPKAVWSPDAKHIFTTQTDDREVLDAPVVDYAPLDSFRPKVIHYREALPGDAHITTFRLTMIDVKTGRQTPVVYPQIPSVHMQDSPADSNRMWWSADSKTTYFIDVERGEKFVHVLAADAATGKTRLLFSETSDTYVELGSDVYSPAMIQVLPKSNQLIWYSERSGWGHLYLYDLTSGRLIRPLTSGQWLVRNIIGMDEDRGQLFVTIAGRTPGKNPYYQEVARIDIATAKMRVLSASNDDHYVTTLGRNDARTASYMNAGGDLPGLRGLSPSCRFFVETVTTVEKPSVTVLRNRNGRLVATIEAAEISHVPSWWRWPKAVEMLAADGSTKIYGVMFKPSDDSGRKQYPVVDDVYGGPQTAFVPTSFDTGDYQDAASIAELGFVAVIIDGRGTTERSRAFHTWSFGKAELSSDLSDHIAAIRQLAASDDSIDTSRVGIIGFSAGGYLAAAGMLRYPDFFKVGVALSGDQDLRLFWNTWGERYEGFPVGNYYDNQANSTYAGNLRGKLLLVHGLLDVGVTPANTFQLEQALIDLNKDFDILTLPRAHHEVQSYAKRRVWDYFVTNLGGNAPPSGFLLQTNDDLQP